MTRPQALAAAHRLLAERTAFDAFVALQGQALVTQWGRPELPINTHSVRKSLISALLGIAVARGMLRWESTLAELGIDEPSTPLTAAEKRATVRDLALSRSGIYLPAAGETAAMTAARPARGAHAPGTFWHYNNWARSSSSRPACPSGRPSRNGWPGPPG